MKICFSLIASLLISNIMAVCNADGVPNNLISTQTVKYDQLFHLEFTLDHPVKEVWPYVVNNREGWLTAFSSKTIKGIRGQEGEVIEISILDKGKAVAQIFYKIIKIIPNRQLVMKLDRFESPIGFMDTAHGYDVYDLQEVNGQTRFTFQTFLEAETTRMSESEFQAVGDKGVVAGIKRWETQFIPALKALLKEAAKENTLN